MKLLPSQNTFISVRSLGLLLALLLMFGSEVLVWTNPVGRPILEWLLLLPGYAVLGAILVDFTVRYRVRDLFGALLLTGIYALAAALVINPASTLTDVPRSLITRVMGAHALIAAEMIGLLLALTSTHPQTRRNLIIGCVIVGMAWGIWVKNWPVEEGFGAVSLPTMLAFGAGGLALIAVYLYVLLPRIQSEPPSDALESFLLTRRGWLICVVVLAGLLAIHLLQAQIDLAGLILCLLLIVLCWGIIWFRERKRGDTLLDGRIPLRSITLPNFIVASLVFLAVGIFAYNLPAIPIGTFTPLTLIGLGFTAYGLAWLPTVSLVLGVQGYLRQLATRKM